jgi:protein-tyrosine-phosphatase
VKARLRIKRALLAGTIAGSMALASTAQAACVSGADEAALQARVLQTELMVAALTCNAKPSYNSFAKKFSTELVRHGRQLRNYFARTYGGRANSELNRFVTELANEASTRSVLVSSSYCADAREKFDEVLALDRNQLAQYASLQPSAQEHGFTSCDTRTASAAPLNPPAPVSKPDQ